MIAVFTRELRGARAAVKFVSEKKAAIQIQRRWRNYRRSYGGGGLATAAAAEAAAARSSGWAVFRRKCNEFVGGRPREVTRLGYWYQVTMTWIHLLVFILGLVASCKLSHWHGHFINQNGDWLYIVLCVVFVLFLLEYLLTILASEKPFRKFFYGVRIINRFIC